MTGQIRKKVVLLGAMLVVSLSFMTPQIASAAGTQSVGSPCSFGNGSNLFALPTWYEYMPGVIGNSHKCQPSLKKLTDIWLIVAAGIDILLRLGALLAVGMVIYGGVLYTTSNGDPETAKKARGVIINALVGLLIAIMAAFFISFLAGSIK